MELESQKRIDPIDVPDVESPLPRPLLAIAFLPSAATLGNLLCGFAAVILCLLSIRAEYLRPDNPWLPNKLVHPVLSELISSYITGGIYMIVLAMICDALDGRLARLARRTSEFGAQLDSLADTVSFGVAPAMLFLTLLLQGAVPASGEPTVSKLEWRLGVFCALTFLSCAAIRLARYNAENTQSESAQKRFTGMPTPGAAGGFCAMLLLHEELVRLNYDVAAGWARWSLGPAALLLAIIMVSRLEHVHLFNTYVRREQPLSHLIGLVLMIGLAIYWIQALLILIAFAYVFSGLAINLVRWVKRRGGDPHDARTPSAN